MIDMATKSRKRLSEYLTLQYPFNVIADPDGGYVIDFPDLPGCMTQVEDLQEVPAMADEIRCLWIETAYAEGEDVPLPSYPEEYSGKFNLRLPRSLHRSLAESAGRDGVSLNQYAVGVLARGDAQAQLEGRLQHIEAQLGVINERLSADDGERGVAPKRLAQGR